jgi:hypothetical protein
VVNSIVATGNIHTLTMNSGLPTTDNDRQALAMWAKLTPDDWATVSASVGYPCGPDENGNVKGAQPMLAIQLAQQRQEGQLQGSVTAGYLTGLLVGQSGDYAKELSNAIDYLGSHDNTSPAWSGDPRRRQIDISA